MASTHLVFTDKTDGLRLAWPKATTALIDTEEGVLVDDLRDIQQVTAKETFDELLKQLEEV